ncbi:hypothetical protein L7F22_018127 [Adiantum nelumboides]|nr:hypothetical protein [Adiantum nelumboides]
MVSACFATVNGSLAAATASSSRLEGRLTLSQTPRSLRSLRPFELRMLSLSVCRGGHRNGYAVVGQAHAELSVEEAQALDASSDEDEREEGDSLSNGPSFVDNGPYGESASKLYVGNLPWSCNSEELADVFQKVGSVDMVEVIYDKESGRSRGFGFVTMSSVEDCNAAIQKLDGADYAGRTLRVNFPNRNRGDSPPPPRAPRMMDQNNANKLFVGNLAWGVDDGMLHELFSEHGKVLEARVVNDRETGRSRGFGFVTMSSEAEVNEALNKMDGANVEGRNLRVNMAGERPTSRSDFF